MFGQVAHENRPLFFKMDKSPKIMKSFSFERRSHENRPLFFKMGRSPKIMRSFSFERRSHENRPLFFKMGRSPKIIRPFSFQRRSPWLSGSLNKPGRPFVFFTSLLYKTLRNFCFVSIAKRGHLLLPNFLPIFLINFQKKSKIAKKQRKPPKNAF
jgi:hypothetical protein